MVPSSKESLARLQNISLWPVRTITRQHVYFSEYLVVPPNCFRSTLPLPQTCTYRVEVTATNRSTRNNGKGDPEGKCPTNREKTSESSLFLIKGEGSSGGNSRKDIEEDSCCFCCAFSKPSGSCVLEIEFTLRYRFRGYDMTGVVVLDGFCGTYFEIMSVKLVS